MFNVTRVYLPPLLPRTKRKHSQFSFAENYVHASRAEIREIIQRFKRAVPSCGIISRYHAYVTRSQMEDMKLHGGLPSEYTSVQRIFRAIVLRLRVPVEFIRGEWPEAAAPIPRHIRVFPSILYYSRNRNRDSPGEFCGREIRQLRDPLSQQPLTIWRAGRPRASPGWNT